MTLPTGTPKFDELKSLTDDQIRELYDGYAAPNAGPSPEFFLNELARREADRRTERIDEYTQRLDRYTRWILWLTVLVTVCTIVNVLLVACPATH